MTTTMTLLKDIVPSAQNNINTKFIVLEKGNATLEGQNKLCMALVADETAAVHVQLWGDECNAFEGGDIIQLTNGIFSYQRNHLVLRSGKRGKMEKVGEFTMAYVETPNMSEIHWIPDPMNTSKMGSTEDNPVSHLDQEIFHKFRDFMTGITKIDELGNVGSKQLCGFQQALEFIRRPPIDTNSILVGKIMEANGTDRVKSYVNSGCKKPNDSVNNVTNLCSCKRGLLNHISKAKVIINELEGLLRDVTSAIQRTHGKLSVFSDIEFGVELNNQAASDDLEENVGFSHSQNTDCTNTEEKNSSDVTHFASLMAILYGMVKQDYLMQEKIVSALDLKVPSEELQSFCEMWSWRPFIDDDIMHQAWKLIP
ncbi:hypothetical protein AHAS_Ahas11G0016700 [Arachis hypogaea]|uniref:DUF7795 domain-containing protein n=2 Tax=Arachis hypogaea TaxID=3818 RepID=A0A445AM68_ARAHY|nr:hypothetical protein Ahy_B01g051520 isoform B [Arachis hypogaea]